MSSPLKETSDLCPTRGSTDERKLAWIAEAREDGEAYLSTQVAWKDIDRIERILSCDTDDETQDFRDLGMSGAEVNRIQREEAEIVDTYSNIRPVGGYETDNPEYDDQCRILDKCSHAWYYNVRVDQILKAALQYASSSTGYLSPFWNPDYWATGEGEIDLEALSAKQVFFVGLPSSLDPQKAYACVIEKSEPVSRVRAMFPDSATNVVPDSGAVGIVRRTVNYASKRLSPLLKGLDERDKAISRKFPDVTLRYTYVDDRSVNRTGQPVRMGKWAKDARNEWAPLTNWSYEVPYLGQQIPTGIRVPTGKRDVGTGDEIFADATRAADERDCRLYPQKRLIVSTPDAILYDGTSYWWHGMFPVVPFRFKTRPGEFLGVSIYKPNLALQASNNRLLRGVDDALNVQLDPPLAADEDFVSETDLKALNLRAPRQRLRINLKAGITPIQPLVKESTYQVSQQVFEHIGQNESRMDHAVALNDVMALNRARQQPAADTVEKIMESIGPVAVGRSRAMEASIMLLGRMTGSLMLQFYDRARRMKILGTAGLTPEDFETFDPNSMVPSEIAGRPDLNNRLKRARYFQSMLKFRVVHGTLHEHTQTTQKMMEMQLWRGGLKIPEGVIAEHFGIENHIKYPAELKTNFEKWQWEQEQIAEAVARIQQKVAEMQQGGGGNDAGGALLGQLLQGLQSNGGRRGRKPSGQQAPRPFMKGDGRTGVSESG